MGLPLGFEKPGFLAFGRPLLRIRTSVGTLYESHSCLDSRLRPIVFLPGLFLAYKGVEEIFVPQGRERPRVDVSPLAPMQFLH